MEWSQKKKRISIVLDASMGSRYRISVMIFHSTFDRNINQI